MLYANVCQVMMLNDDNHINLDVGIGNGDDGIQIHSHTFAYMQTVFVEISAFGAQTLHMLSTIPLDCKACVPTLYTYSRERKIKSFEYVLMVGEYSMKDVGSGLHAIGEHI